MKIRAQILFHLLVILFYQAEGQTPPILCENEPMIIYSDTNRISKLYKIKLDPAQPNIQLTPFDQTAGLEINGIGYRQQDQFVYGSGGANIVRIDGTGAGNPVTDIGLSSFAGDISPDGKYLVYAGLSELIITELESGFYEMHKVPYIFMKPAATPASLDIAFNPTTGILYGFDAANKNLIVINPVTGVVNNVLYPPIAIENGIPALFFDSYGNLWGYSTGNFYQINTVNGLVEASIPYPIQSSGRIDGCSCPGSFNFQKSAWPDTVSRCGTLDYLFAVSNRTGQTQSNVSIEDHLPAGMTIEEIVRNPFGGQVSGVGGDFLNATGLSIPEGIDTLIVRVRLNQLDPGIYFNQASIKNIKIHSANAVSLLSDNPSTHTINDSTKVFVKELPEVKRYIEYSYLCNGDSTLLSCHLPGMKEYAWSTGETGAEIVVDQPGAYTLNLDSGCELAEWQFQVNDASIYFDLGADQTIYSGDTLPFPVQVTGIGKLISNVWTPEPYAISLNCLQCVSNAVFPVDDTRYSLTVTNEYRCTATDDVFIHVERPFYAPNVFDPGRPSPNNVFFLQSKNPIQINRIQVFDRWGELVYERKGIFTNDENNAWDGAMNGRKMPPGVYVWKAELLHANGSVEYRDGDVTLLE